MKGLANDTASYSLRELRSQKLDATWCLGCGQGNARQQVLCRIASASRCPSRGYGEVSGTVYSSEATPRAASFKLSLDSELLGKPTNHRIRRLWAVGITQLSEPNKLNCEFEPSDLRPTLEFDTVTTLMEPSPGHQMARAATCKLSHEISRFLLESWDSNFC